MSDVAKRHAKLLMQIADQLVRWAKESQKGGWSTHQVGPQIKLADQIYQHLLSERSISIPEDENTPARCQGNGSSEDQNPS